MAVIVAPALEMAAEQREVLEAMACSHTAPYRVVRQARALLWAGEGLPNAEIARRSGATAKTVRRWRSRFAAEGPASVGRVRPGRGRPRVIGEEVAEAIVADTLTAEPPGAAGCWSTREMADRHGVGKDYVARVWRERRLRPWLANVFKLSADPDFEAKLKDVIGLYVDPPERAAVFSFDEKTQVQAIDRTQPSLPLVPGRNRTVTHDYRRNGTVDLFAALDVATGEVLHQTRRRHTGADVLAFFKQIDSRTPEGLDVHVILDNLSAHKSAPVRRWLSNPRRSRWHLHFTPTSSSWANLIEGWFSILARKALKNRSFSSVADLQDAIDTWAQHWNNNPQPLRWTKPAEQIIARTTRAQATLTRITKSATDH